MTLLAYKLEYDTLKWWHVFLPGWTTLSIWLYQLTERQYFYIHTARKLKHSWKLHCTKLNFKFSSQNNFNCFWKILNFEENARRTTATTASAIGRPATGATLGTAAKASWHGRNGRSGASCTRRLRVKGEWHFGFVESGTRPGLIKTNFDDT